MSVIIVYGRVITVRNFVYKKYAGSRVISEYK